MNPFEYAVLRAVPRVDRGEFVNVGVVLYCQAADFLGCSAAEPTKVLALDPDCDVEGLTGALDAVRAVCDGDPDAGPAARQPLRARFGWLTAPRSTILQPGPVHPGVTADPGAELTRLFGRLVA